MALEFYKYQGTGNDFIMVDNRHDKFNKNNTKHIAWLCDRRFGIGADGLILLERHRSVDFKMVYFNADGNESTMCGNGGRCITAFANYLGIIAADASFEAIDGLHTATIHGKTVNLQMQDVTKIKDFKEYLFLDTGSPHHVKLERNLDALDVKAEGAAIRYSKLYGEKGSNVNFVQPISKKEFAIRTYERGVEDETLSCGTGVTAAALAMHYSGRTSETRITLNTQGGSLEVAFTPCDAGYKDIWLKGEAVQVFKGEVSW